MCLSYFATGTPLHSCVRTDPEDIRLSQGLFIVMLYIYEV